MSSAQGVFGGTFNPIHVGHLLVAEEVRQIFGLERVVFVPSAIPPHKSPEGLIPVEHRLNMALLATLDNPYFEVSTIEAERGGRSFTYDTLQAFRARLPEDSRLYFILGADAFLEIDTWHRAEELFGLCQFVVISRPGISLGQVEEYLAGGFFVRCGRPSLQVVAARQVKDKEGAYLEAERPQDRCVKGRVYFVDALWVDISSSGIRRLVACGRSIRYLVPQAVEEYILKYGLYREEGGH